MKAFMHCFSVANKNVLNAFFGCELFAEMF